MNFLQFAVRSLGKRAQHSSEIRKKLKERGCSSQEIDLVIEKLTDIGALDDAAWLSQVIIGYHNKQLSKLAIAQKLKQKGVPFAEWKDKLGDSDLEAAKAYYSKIKGKKEGPKLVAALARRGFSWDIIKQITKHDD